MGSRCGVCLSRDQCALYGCGKAEVALGIQGDTGTKVWGQGSMCQRLKARGPHGLALITEASVPGSRSGLTMRDTRGHSVTALQKATDTGLRCPQPRAR